MKKSLELQQNIKPLFMKKFLQILAVVEKKAGGFPRYEL